MFMKVYQSKWFRYGMLLCMFVGTFIQYQVRAPQRNFSDFHVPYWIGHKMLAGQEIYSYDTGLSYFKYTPFYANLTVNFAVFPQHTAANIWYICNFIFFMVIFHCFRKIIAKEDGYDSFLLYTLTLWVMFRFMLQNMHEGQANVFMIALFTLGMYFYTQKKYVAAAFFMAYSIMTKYMTAVFLPYFLIAGNIPVLLYTGGFTLLLYFFPALGFGLERNIILIKNQLSFLFQSSMDGPSITTHANQSLWGLVGRFFWKESVYDINLFQLDKAALCAIVLGLGVVLYWLAVYPLRRAKFTLNEHQKRWCMIYDWAMIFICMALLNPNGWMNFFVALIFPVMVILHYLIRVKGKDALIMTLFVLHFILNSWTSQACVEWFAGDSFEIWSSVTAGSLLLFAAIFILKLRLLKGRYPIPAVN